MPETKEKEYCGSESVCDALRFLCDASYAVLPRDVAHTVAELQKNFWGGVRWVAEKRIEWIDARVAGGDRLRDEWKRQRDKAGSGTYDAPGGGI